MIAIPVIMRKGITQADLDAAIGAISSTVFVHSEPAPSALWTVNHNLGFMPDVATYTTGGLEFIAEVLHISNNQLTITMALPTAGFARCT